MSNRNYNITSNSSNSSDIDNFLILIFALLGGLILLMLPVVVWNYFRTRKLLSRKSFRKLIKPTSPRKLKSFQTAVLSPNMSKSYDGAELDEYFQQQKLNRKDSKTTPKPVRGIAVKKSISFALIENISFSRKEAPKFSDMAQIEHEPKPETLDHNL